MEFCVGGRWDMDLWAAFGGFTSVWVPFCLVGLGRRSSSYCGLLFMSTTKLWWVGYFGVDDREWAFLEPKRLVVIEIDLRSTASDTEAVESVEEDEDDDER